ncbi:MULTISPECIES: helix-turn-helix domain-containing protein [unclassified Sphingobium]|uniref:helix-turn-helix domain-containing protein n=1 Tax=unclassified Sphingobium TaxID=2611147 RepID=UPI000D17A7C3|nr:MULTISPECIES: helix-turn-helix domain-containing protein [unclassified Sphingobium]PSO09716.1 helix-turn-helix domain-containing protein [Sphingobium sp. AEW4]TWD19039.1 helix-turn-helix protein [Sphingobium sp. AEW013]
MGTLAFGEVLVGALGGHLTGSGKRAPRKRRSGAPHPTGAPVLRDSVEEGTFEHLFFTAPAKGETDQLLRAARRILDAGRQLRREARSDGRVLTPGEQRLTTLTAASVRVFEEILTLARLNKGRVFPSYDYLADATSLGRATVARALRILEGIGFLVRQRRFKKVEGDGPGPRYAQTSNVYRAFLPDIVARYLPRWMRPAPLPDDAVQREADRQDEMAMMRKTLDHREQREAMEKGVLAKVLARIEAAIERQDALAERESQKHPQPLNNSFIKGTSGVGLSRPTRQRLTAQPDVPSRHP